MSKRKAFASKKINDDPLNSGSDSDMEIIKKELKQLRNAIEKQNSSINTISTMLRGLIKDESFSNKYESKFMFPIETDADLGELDKEVNKNPEKYHQIFRDMIFGCGGLEKKLKSILSAEVALVYNWDGTNGKKPFKNLKNLNVALFKAMSPEITSPEVFKKAIREGLKRIKNLHFKKVSLQKKINNKDSIFEEPSQKKHDTKDSLFEELLL